jgi:hypothetical protein
MVDSPCVKRCTLDADGICEGCFRMLDEIAAWPMADEALRRPRGAPRLDETAGWIQHAAALDGDCQHARRGHRPLPR